MKRAKKGVVFLFAVVLSISLGGCVFVDRVDRKDDPYWAQRQFLR